MRCLCFWLCILAFWHVQAQVRVSGRVEGIDKKPLALVNILAYQIENKDTTLTKYAISDAKGLFSLSLPKNQKHLIKAKALGYADGSLLVSPKDSVVFHTFTLLPKAIELREVVVKSPPVRANNDTTTFKAKAFIDGSERNVEDLLRKLPGVRVAENGKITVHGKAVDKVMIEGEDLFSKNYQIITRSLAAGALDKVEAIDNYSENPLLKGIEKSNKMVLNLSVRPDLKIRPFGNVGGDVGYKNKYGLNTTLLTLLGKLKGGIVGNMNNTGHDPISASEYELNAEDDIQGFSTIQSNLLASIPLTMVSVPDLEPRRVTFNSAKLIGATATYKLSQKLKLKGFSYLYNDRLQLESGNRTQYFFEGKNVQFRDSSLQTRSPKLWTNQLKAEYNLDAKTNLKYTFTHRGSEISNTIFFDTQNLQLSEKIPINGQDVIEVANHRLNAVRRIDDKNALIADVSYLSSSLSRLNSSQSQRYAAYFKINKAFQTARQSIDQNQQELKMTLRWKNVNKWGNLSVGLGYLHKEDHTASDFSIKADNNQMYRPTTGFKNDIEYQNDIVLLDAQQTFQVGVFRWNVGGTAQWTNAILKNAIQKNTDFTTSKFILQPTLGLSATLGEHSRLTALYYNQQLLPSTEQFTTNYIQSSYRDFQKNAGVFYVSKNNNWLLSYNNTDWTRLYAINVGVSYNRSHFYNSYEFGFSDLLNFSTNRPIETTLNQVSANWQLDRLISPLSTKIRLEGNIGQSEILNRVNGSNLLPNNAQHLDNKIYLISAFDGFFNFQASARYSLSRVVQKNAVENSLQTTLFVPNLTLRLRPMSGFSIKISAEQLNWYNVNSHDVTNLLDIDLLYHATNSPFTFSMSGNNLLDTKYIFYTNVSVYSNVQNKYALQPRWVLASMSMSF
jgi:hypothetical protein